MPWQITAETALADITPQVIEHFLQHDVDEDIYFDFKQGIQSQDVREKHRIRRALVSFANTLGGFIFFGVLDKANAESKVGLDRVIGIDNPGELGPLITSKYLDKGYCVPLIDFEGPIAIPVGAKLVAGIKVLRTEKGPHGIRSSPEGALQFWDRGSGAVRAMGYADLAREFDRQREARGWLIALAVDLQSIRSKAKDAQTRATNNPPYELPPRFNSIIQTSAGDVLRVLGNDSVLVEKLLPLRDLLDEADAQRDYMQARVREQPPYTPSVTPRPEQVQWVEKMRQLKMSTSLPALQIANQADMLLQHMVKTYPVARERLQASVNS